MRNTIVLRPRLLTSVRFAPFAASSNAPPFRPNTKFHGLVPRVELIRPTDPNKLPTQVKVTVPMTQLPKVGSNPEVYAFDLSLGWHDPSGADANKLKRVRVAINDLKVHRQDGKMRFKSAVNGRWHSITAAVEEEDFDQDEFFSTPAAQRPTNRVVELFLPEEARLIIHSHGTWLHGFGEKLEDNSLQTRKLRFGGLIPIPQEMQDTLDALKKLVAAGQTLTPGQQATLDQIESFLKRLEQFIGVNKDVEWLLDIDAERDKQDRAVEKQRVSILARELWVKLLPLFNVQNVPMGWYTFISVEHSSHAREHGGSLLHSGTDCGLVSQLVAKRRELGGPIPVKCHARQWESVGSGNLLGERMKRADPDYSFSMFLDVRDQLVSS
jgi:hypothetical protein